MSARLAVYIQSGLRLIGVTYLETPLHKFIFIRRIFLDLKELKKVNYHMT